MMREDLAKHAAVLLTGTGLDPASAAALAATGVTDATDPAAVPALAAMHAGWRATGSGGGS